MKKSMFAFVAIVASISTCASVKADDIVVLPGQIGRKEAKTNDGSCPRFYLPGNTLCVLGDGMKAWNLDATRVLVLVPTGVSPQFGFVTTKDFKSFDPATVYGVGYESGVNSVSLDSIGSWYMSFYSTEASFKTSQSPEELKKLKGELDDLRKEVKKLAKAKGKVDVKDDTLASDPTK